MPNKVRLCPFAAKEPYVLLKNHSFKGPQDNTGFTLFSFCLFSDPGVHSSNLDLPTRTLEHIIV